MFRLITTYRGYAQHMSVGRNNGATIADRARTDKLIALSMDECATRLSTASLIHHVQQSIITRPGRPTPEGFDSIVGCNYSGMLCSRLRNKQVGILVMRHACSQISLYQLPRDVRDKSVTNP